MEISPREVIAMLGGARGLGTEVTDLVQFDEVMRRGLPHAAYDALVDHMRLSAEEQKLLPKELHVSTKLLAGGNKAPLDKQESEIVERIARTYALAKLALGEEEHAKAWLLKPHGRLDGKKPVDLLTTDVGARHVEHILASILYSLPA